MSWWQANRWYLIALVPVTVAALAVTAFQAVVLVVPWTPREVANSDTSIRFTTADSHAVYPGPVDYSVTITLKGVAPVSELPPESSLASKLYGPTTAAPGARLWRVDLDFDADPDMALGECALSVMDAHEQHYSADAGKLSEGVPYVPPLASSCVPKETPGPWTDLYFDVQPPFEDPRPARWTKSAYFAVPTTVIPDRVRIDLGSSGYKTINLGL